MTRVLITGSADGLGRLAAQSLLADGHEVVLHARNRERLTAVRDLVDRGAAAVVGDLADMEQTRAVADEVNELGRMDAVIHNAGVYSGPHILAVSIVAPYLLTALIERPKCLVYLSSSEHRGGAPTWPASTGPAGPGATPTASSTSPRLPRQSPGCGRMSSAMGSTRDGCPPGWAGLARPTTCGLGTSLKSGSPPATSPGGRRPAPTGTTSPPTTPPPPSPTPPFRTSRPT